MNRNVSKVFACFIAAVFYIAPDEAKAGHWSSGGGEILEHAQNPWFLDASSTSRPIRYCVASGADFPVGLAELEDLVARTFRWWNDQFSNAHYPDNKFEIGGQQVNLQVRVNTSRYIKEACTSDTELSFQFGTLTPDQETEFRRLQIDLTRYVALTIRTDYSDDLRGKGFIYISPDRGPNAFRGQNVRPEAWADKGYNTRLQSVLTHELGHVFGLAHADSNGSIMSGRHAELVVSKFSAGISDDLLAINNGVFFPKAKDIGEVCGNTEHNKTFRDFFEIPSEMECFSVRLTLNSLIVQMSEKRESPRMLVGIARFVDGGQRRHNQLVTLWIPQTQRVFPDLPSYISSLLGPAGSEVQHSAVFRNQRTFKEKAIFVQASSSYVQIGGVSESGIIPDLLPESAYGRALSGWSSR